MLNYILGVECPICNSALDNDIICNNCINKIKYIPKLNYIHNNGDFYFTKFHTLLEFNDILKKIIHLYKFENKRKFSKLLSDLIQKRYDLSFFEQYDYIIPVPLHNKKLRKRGFNQTIEVLKKIIDEKYIFTEIFKVKASKQQSLVKSREERKENLKDIFEIPKESIKLIENKRILLFDDIFTTGATLNSFAQPFYYSMAKEIHVLTIGVS